MKKLLTWALVLLCLLALAGCTDAGEEADGNGEPEPAAADAGEVQAKGAMVFVVRVNRGASEPAAFLAQEDAAVILELLADADWTEGTADCLNDCMLTVNGESLYYSSDCGTFNDSANERSLLLPEGRRVAVNAMLENYITLGFDAEIIEISLEDSDAWGVTLSAKDVSATGLTLVCTQSGGAPAGELQTGSRYWLETYADGAWRQVPETPAEDGAVRVWTDEAYPIPMSGSVEWEVDWEWLYGELPAGDYRIGKEIMDFRGTGDYDGRNYYAEFTIT